MSADLELLKHFRRQVCEPCWNKGNCPFVGEPYDPSRDFGIPQNFGFCHELICREGREEGWEVHRNGSKFTSRKVDNRRKPVKAKSVGGFEKEFYVTDDGFMVVTNGRSWRVSGQRMEEPTWKNNLK